MRKCLVLWWDNLVYWVQKSMNEGIELSERDYSVLLQQAVAEIRDGRATAAFHINSALTGVYWKLGKLIVERKLDSKHGSRGVKQLAYYLNQKFPYMGFSERNLWYMKRFYLRYVDEDPKLQQAVAVLPWGHNLLLMEKGQNSEQVMFYAKEIISKGWSREMLLHAVKGDYYANLLATPQSNNFAQTLPAPVANYANEVFRSRYNLGFLGVTGSMKELKLENRLVGKITRFILELGNGFTFIGNQHIIHFNGKRI